MSADVIDLGAERAKRMRAREWVFAAVALALALAWWGRA